MDIKGKINREIKPYYCDCDYCKETRELAAKAKELYETKKLATQNQINDEFYGKISELYKNDANLLSELNKQDIRIEELTKKLADTIAELAEVKSYISDIKVRLLQAEVNIQKKNSSSSVDIKIVSDEKFTIIPITSDNSKQVLLQEDSIEEMEDQLLQESSDSSR